MVPFHGAHNLCIRGRNYFHLTCVYTDCSQNYLFKVKGYNVFLLKVMYYKYLNNNLRTVVDFLGQSTYALFRPVPQIFIFAPPHWKKLCPAHPWYIQQHLSLKGGVCLRNLRSVS